MADENEEQVSIVEEFEVVQSLFQEIDTTDESPMHASVQERIREAIGRLNRIARLVQSLSLFSTNEEISDIPTSHLQFLLVDYYLGDLHLRPMGGLDRKKQLETSSMFLSAFLTRCDNLGLVEEEDRCDVLEEAEDLSNPAKRRERKIARFRKEKEAQERLNHILYIKEQAKRAGMDSPDEELTREQYMLLIQSSIRKALDHGRIIKEEGELLEHMAKMGTNISEDKPSKPLTILRIDEDFLSSKRQEYLEAVFRDRMRPPTMTLEELLEIEREKAEQQSKLAENMPKPKKKMKNILEEGLEDDEALVDEATIADRSWDDWKDDHVKGSGNMLRNR